MKLNSCRECGKGIIPAWTTCNDCSGYKPRSKKTKTNTSSPMSRAEIELNTRKTSNQWKSQLYPHLTIIDADGWDRKNFDYSFNKERITRAEFDKRILMSTIQTKP